ncbi:MAG: formate hydrogenlyase [Solirubrobacterales bacterium]|nr:formate hydrogenlyase [Solirubrobacterales bacterium]
MSATIAAAAVVQLAGAVALAPLIPGAVRAVERRLQGLRGPSPLQPYRELRRLWRRSGVAPVPRTAVYAVAPPLAAAATLAAALLVPVGAVAPDWGLGGDALLLVGLLALGRAALALAAWDTGSGFALMGAARDLAFAPYLEALLLAVVAIAAVGAGTTDLGEIAAATAERPLLSAPEQWLAALAFALVAVAESGRRPYDNPDTHLELTMIHEGPLLEYAGRELALLQWTAAVRQWVAIVLGVALFAPVGGPWAGRVAALAGLVAVAVVALAVSETAQAKMRLLRVPRWVGAGVAVCAVAVVLRAIGGAP